MIERITLRNYRGHTRTTIACGRFTVLVGENATGKTSVLRAVQWISGGSGSTLPAYLLRRGASELEVVLDRSGSGKPIQTAYRKEEGKDDLQSTEAPASDDRPRAAFLSLNAEDLAAPSGSKLVVPALDPSGRGLASVLAYLKLAETERFDRIVERLREVVPIVRGIGFARVAGSEIVPRVIRVEDHQVELADMVTTIQDALLFDFADADRVPATLVSEGTLITLGMLTALDLIPVDVVLIDDIDRALHPRAQRKLVETLHKALETTPNLQIIATSHSPYLIDELRPEEVTVLGRGADGAIVAKRLDAFPDERLREMLSTGELWMSEGDAWATR